MNCREFERLWNEALDLPPDSKSEPDSATRTHEASCPACRLMGTGYRAIRRGLTEPSPRPEVPLGFADRVLAAAAAERSPGTMTLAMRWLVPLATAAVVLLSISPGLRELWNRPGRLPMAKAEAVESDPEDLSAALADIGVASLSLAKEATAPSARVGGEVIAAAGLSDGVARLGLPLPGINNPSSALWEGVGQRVNAGVRPLSGTARSAFGFLVGLAPES